MDLLNDGGGFRMKTAKSFRMMMVTIVAAGLLFLLPSIASAQGRGRGFGGRGFSLGQGRGHDQSWKCGKFVNCHDARNGRLDGRGPSRRTGFWQNGIYNPRGTSIGYRHRYSTNDYWRRRHLMYRRQDLNNNWRYNNLRYRNRTWRDR